MADKILKELTLKIWRQKDAKSKGGFETYTRFMIFQPVASFLEMLDILNEQLVRTRTKNRWLSITTVARVSVEPVVYSSMDVPTDRMMT